MTQVLVNNLLSKLCEENKYTQYDYIDLKIIDTQNVLAHLIHTKEFSQSNTDSLFNLEHQINVTGKIVTQYTNKWKPTECAKPLPDKWMDIFTLLLYKNFLCTDSIDSNIKTVELLKTMNSILKCLDLATTDWLKINSDLYNSITNDFTRLTNSISAHAYSCSNTLIDKNKSIDKSLRILPITILYSESPIARAYLATIYSMGFSPQKIIHLVASHDIVTKKPVGSLLFGNLRKNYAANMQQIKIHNWSNVISKKQPELKQAIFKSITGKYQFSQDTLDDANKLQPLSYYCPNIESILIKNLRDTALTQYLTQLPKSTLLYTGGGIMPKHLLDIPTIKILHIHPGFLPSLRGADCTLWSLLCHGTNSASCFYMNEGIDTGDIILTSWLPKISFDVSHTAYDLQTLYQSIYNYFDPWVRSFVLKQVIKKYSDTNFFELSATKQVKDSGTTLHFMHNQIKAVVMDKLFLK